MSRSWPIINMLLKFGTGAYSSTFELARFELPRFETGIFKMGNFKTGKFKTGLAENLGLCILNISIFVIKSDCQLATHNSKNDLPLIGPQYFLLEISLLTRLLIHLY